MIEIKIPGRNELAIENIVFDFNGTIAIDGHIVESLRERFEQLSKLANLYVLTADTHGNAKEECDKYGLKIITLVNGDTVNEKLREIKKLNPKTTACLGNGYNDFKMLGEAELSIGIISDEGIYSGLINNTDIIVKSIEDGIDLLLKPKRLIATLRN